MTITLRNGREVFTDGYILNPEINFDVVTKTDNYTVLRTDTGKTLVMNSSSNKTFTLPTVTAADVGLTYTFVGLGTGRITLQAGTSDTIDDSAAAGTAYSDDNAIATYTVRCCSASAWECLGANGTWTTT